MESGQEKVPLPKKQIIDWKPPDRSVQAGDVTVLFKIAQDLEIAETIDRICDSKGERKTNSPEKLLTAYAINRALYPESATQLEDRVESTVLTDILICPQKDSIKTVSYPLLIPFILMIEHLIE